MTTIFHDRDADGSIWWRERVFMLSEIFLIRICEKSFKIEINYKTKPKESIMCSNEEVDYIIKQLDKNANPDEKT